MNRINHTKTLTVAIAACLLMGAGVIATAATQNTGQAQAQTYSRAYLHSYNLDSSGLALEGYCPVTYHTHNAARKGSADFASTYNGVAYHLVSAEAKKRFDANPEMYLPAYGGWCAFGMAIQDKFPVDPTNFKVVDGRLMLFLRNQNLDALSFWNQNDEQEQVEKANAHWKKVSG